MSTRWLADMAEYLGDHKVADERFNSCLKKAVKSLRELEVSEEKSHDLDGGILDFALNKLENDYHRLLIENSFPLPISSSVLPDKQPCVAPSCLPNSVVQKLQATTKKLTANGRLDKCISIYAEVRSSNVKASLQALNLDYLDTPVSELNDNPSTEALIFKWGMHFEFALKHLFEAEYKLCHDVFAKTGLDVFAKIAVKSGFLAFLQFGKTVTESKKDPAKLVKLLDIFALLSKVRTEFNKLFGSDPCAEIRDLTRELIKRIIEGACEIFWELAAQADLQRKTPPPLDCSVPLVVTCITDYCNKLLSDEYKPVLTQVLIIERSWSKRGKFQESVLTEEFLKLVRAIERNLDTWSKGYKDPVLCSLFLMNSHYHLYKYLKGTKLGGLLGDSWLKEHEQYTEFCLTRYLKESWSTLPSLLKNEGLVATSRNLAKRRLKSFSDEFEETCKKQSGLVIADKEVRKKSCRIIVQTVVPVYQKLLEEDPGASKHAKYTTQALEEMINALFVPKPIKHRCSKARNPSAK